MKKIFVIIYTFFTFFSYSSQDIIYFSIEDLNKYQTILLVIDPEDGTILQASQGAKDFYGYKNLIGMKISEINTLSEKQIKKEMEKARTEKRNYFRFKHRLANNKIKNVEVNSYPMKYKNKDILISRIRDIDNEIIKTLILYFSYFLILTIVLFFLIIFFFLFIKLKKNKLELQKEIDLLNKIGEITNIGGWEIDPITREVRWSDEVYKIHEVEKDKYTPELESAINFYDEESKDIIRENVARLTKEGKEYDLNLKIITAKKNKKDVRTKGYVIKDKNGKIVKVYGTIQDLTEIKQKENYLIKAKEESEKANLIKFEFLMNINHQLRTPLNSIIGFLKIVLGIEENKQKKEYLQIAYKSSLELFDLINKLLDFSKIKINQYELELKNTNIFNLVTDFCNIYKNKCNENNITIKFEIDERFKKEEVLIDKDGILKILNNLLSNFCNFTNQKNNEEVLLLCKRLDNNIKIEIKNRDLYIPEDRYEKIINSFKTNEVFVADEMIINFLITKHLVDILNGTIEIISEKDKGTEVIIYIPFKEAVNQNLNKNNNKNNKEEQKELANKEKEIINGLKIISAEDSEINQKLLEVMLKSENIIFKKVYNGKELIEELEKERYDIILMDVQMPGMDGIEATKIIRNRPFYANTPIIGISAFNFPEEIELIIKAGMNDFISKPINKKDLMEKIKKWHETKNQKD